MAEPTRDEQFEMILPRFAKFQKNIEDAIKLKQDGSHRLNVIVLNGQIRKVQVFAEDTAEFTTQSNGGVKEDS